MYRSIEVYRSIETQMYRSIETQRKRKYGNIDLWRSETLRKILQRLQKRIEFCVRIYMGPGLILEHAWHRPKGAQLRLRTELGYKPPPESQTKRHAGVGQTQKWPSKTLENFMTIETAAPRGGDRTCCLNVTKSIVCHIRTNKHRHFPGVLDRT